MPETSVYLERILEEGIKPCAAMISEIAEGGGIAVLVYKATGKSAKHAIRKMGGSGLHTHAFRLSSEYTSVIASSDHVTRQWVARSEDGLAKILVISGHGTLLVNFHRERGFWIEPGSADEQVLN
jgi:hypothetical protein